MNLTNQQTGSLLAFTAIMFITPDSLLIRLSNVESWNLIFYRGIIPFFAVFQSSSKGAMISLLLGISFIFVTSWKYIENSSFIKVVIILTAAFLFANIQTEGYTVNRVNELSGTAFVPQLGVRLLLWESAWQIIKTSPIIGTGIGTFFIVFPAVRAPADSTSGNYLHNDYLQFWLETGFIGLCLMILIG